jgi:transposase
LEIRVLHRHGKGIREIARETGSSRNTVRRYRRDESAARYKPRPLRATTLDPLRDYVIERLTSAAPEWIPASVLLRELRERGYTGGYTMLKGLVQRHGYGRGRHRFHPGFLDFA